MMYLLSITDVLWQSGLVMKNCRTNSKEYMKTLSFIREYFETQVTNEGLMNYGHSRDTYNFVEKLEVVNLTVEGCKLERGWKQTEA